MRAGLRQQCERRFFGQVANEQLPGGVIFIRLASASTDFWSRLDKQADSRGGGHEITRQEKIDAKWCVLVFEVTLELFNRLLEELRGLLNTPNHTDAAWR